MKWKYRYASGCRGARRLRCSR